MDKIILIGFGGHAKSIVDSLKSADEYEIIGYTDINPGENYHGCPYLGTDDVLPKYYTDGIRYAFVGIGYMGKGDLRRKLYMQLKKTGYTLPAIIDPSAILAADVQLGEGCFVGKNAIINSGAVIDRMCIINSGAIVEHECTVGEFSHISVGTVLCGRVTVGTDAFVGANATVIQGRSVGDGCIVGAGEVLRKDMKEMKRF